MKRMLVCLLLISLIGLIGCKQTSSGGTQGNYSLSGTDFQKDFHNGNTGTSIACESKDGYFFLKNDYLYYVDKKTMGTTLVCNKPECKHNDDTCNAYVESEQIAYSENKLYYAISGRNNVIFSMDLDGSSRKEVATYSTTLSSAFIAHRGYLYYIDNLHLYRTQIDHPSNKKMMFEFTDVSDTAYFKLWADGEKIYIWTVSKENVEEFYEGDLQGNKCKKGLSVDQIQEDWLTKGIGVNGWYIHDNSIYYYLCGNGIWAYNFTNKKYTQIAKITDKLQQGFASFDEHYIYIDTSNPALGVQSASDYAIYVYNYQGGLVGTIPTGKSYMDTGLTGFAIICTTPQGIFGLGTTNKELMYSFAKTDMTFNETQVLFAPMPNKGEGLNEINFENFAAKPDQSEESVETTNMEPTN